jgi:hypothetical protein
LNPARAVPISLDQSEPVQSWREAVIALPFVVLCGLGWVTWLPEWLVVLLVLVVFLARRVPSTNRYAPWASVYAALPAVLVGPDWTARLTAFFAGLVLAYLIGTALDGVRLGSRWSWLGPLLILAVWPSPWGALGGLGLGVLGALENRRIRAQGEAGHVRPEALLALGLTGLGLTGLALALLTLGLGGSTLTRLNLGSLNQPPEQISSLTTNPSEIKATSANAREGSSRPPAQLGASEAVMLTIQVILVVMLLILGMVLLRVRIGARPGKPSSWSDLIPILAAFILVASLLAWSVIGRSGGLGDASNSSSAGSAVQNGQSNRNTLQNGAEQLPSRDAGPVWPLLVSVLMVGLAGAYMLWKLRALQDESSALPEPEATEPSQNRIEATNRVRAAYRAFLVLTTQAGLPKSEAETPLEFADRVVAREPEAHEAARRLTHRYEPVRYGQLSDSVGALEAEAALKELRGILEPVSNTTFKNTANTRAEGR